MDPKEFEQEMENLKTPKVEDVSVPIEIKLAIVSAQRSATIGIWSVVVPVFFIACVVMKYYLHLNLGLLEIFEDTIMTLDRNPKTWWIQPVLLIGLPVGAIILNVLSITHFKWDGHTKSITLTFKVRWINLVVLAISGLIVGFFLLFLIVENFQARPGH